MKSITKRIISLFSAFVLVVMAWSGFLCPYQAVASDEQEASPYDMGDYEYITLSDFEDTSACSMPDGVYEDSSGKGTGKDYKYYLKGRTNLDKTMLSMKIKFTIGSSAIHARLHLSGTGNSFGLYPEISGEKFYLRAWEKDAGKATTKTLTASTAGLPSFVGHEFLLQVSFELGDFDGENDDKDVKIGLYFNGKLYDEQKFVFYDCKTDVLSNVLGVYVEDNLSDEQTPSVELASVVADNFEKITLSDFKNSDYDIMEDSTYTDMPSASGEQYSYSLAEYDNLNRTFISMSMKYITGSQSYHTRLHLGGSVATGGFGIEVSPDGTQMYLKDRGGIAGSSGAKLKTIAASDVPNVDSFVGEDFLFGISFEHGNFDGENDKIDVKIGLYFENVLYEGKYIKVFDCDSTKLGNCLGIYIEDNDFTDATVPAITLSSIGQNPEPVYLDGYEEYTINDFTKSNLKDREYQFVDSNSGGKSYGYALDDCTDLNRTLISMKIKFAVGSKTYHTRLHLGGSSASGGFGIEVSTDGTKMHLKDRGGFTENVGGILATMLAKNTDISSYIDGEFLLQVSMEYGNFDEDPNDTKNDIKLGFYFNGKLYGGQEFTLNNCNVEGVFGNMLGVYVEDDASDEKVPAITLSNTDIRMVHELSNGPYCYVSSDGIWLNNESVSGIYLSGPGQYLIATDTNTNWNKLVVYLLGDANLDGVCDIKDLVAEKKSLQSDSITEAGILAADMNKNGIISRDDVNVMRKFLVNDLQDNANRSVSMEFIGGQDVMPIGGYFGPCLEEQITDSYFQKISELGINLITYTQLDYNSKPDLVKTYLDLGEKYGIGIFVTDGTVASKAGGNVVTKQELADAIKRYQSHPAFCGMYLIDEPDATYYYAERIAKKLISSYGSLSQTLQYDFDTLCYSNMLPYSNTSFDKSLYQQYVQEFCETFRPKVLMWDYYVYGDYGNKERYFWNMDLIRTYAEKYNIPFWSFIQAGGQWKAKDNYAQGANFPNEGEFRWNVNTSLAFGAQGIQYFPLIQPGSFVYEPSDGETEYTRSGLIGYTGNKNQWFDYAKEMNKQIAAIDKVLMNSVHKGIIVKGEQATADTEQTSCVIESGAFQELTSVTGDVMVGCFDYNGKTALYVVNYSAENEQNVELSFDDNYNIEQVQDTKSTYVKTNNLSLNMAAGEGVLLVVE